MATQKFGGKVNVATPEASSSDDGVTDVIIKTTQATAIDTTTALVTITTTTSSASARPKTVSVVTSANTNTRPKTNVSSASTNANPKTNMNLRSSQHVPTYIPPLVQKLRNPSMDPVEGQINQFDEALDDQNKRLETALTKAYRDIKNMEEELIQKHEELHELQDRTLDMDVERARLDELNTDQSERTDSYSKKLDESRKVISELRGSLYQSKKDLDTAEREKDGWERKFKDNVTLTKQRLDELEEKKKQDDLNFSVILDDNTTLGKEIKKLKELVKEQTASSTNQSQRQYMQTPSFNDHYNQTVSDEHRSTDRIPLRTMSPFTCKFDIN